MPLRKANKNSSRRRQFHKRCLRRGHCRCKRRPASRRECRSRRGRRNLSRPCSRSRIRHRSSLLRLMPAGKPYCQCHDHCPKHNGNRQPQNVPVREFQPAKYTRPLWPCEPFPQIIRQHSVKRLSPPCRILLCDSIEFSSAIRFIVLKDGFPASSIRSVISGLFMLKDRPRLRCS